MKRLASRNRRDIYYWKCHLAAAFHMSDEGLKAEARSRVEAA
jgi:hypothetical protein